VPVAYPLGLSGIQWTCLVALAVYLPLTLRAARHTA
jgi:phosphatidylglycerol---prolipoprotein diacylglyceryl transferase